MFNGSAMAMEALEFNKNIKAPVSSDFRSSSIQSCSVSSQKACKPDGRHYPGKLALEGVDSLMPRYLKVMLVEILKASIGTLADGIRFRAKATGGVVEETAPCYRERNV
ncbi:hypothetical protein VNO77_19636 [Canavalia gladiata]|uniref:Uncharacterized protein n=1 Tax=Canavalia gladiata TaxID=3824 RepID=A0AAN9LMW8_CANGL